MWGGGATATTTTVIGNVELNQRVMAVFPLFTTDRQQQ
jgi:hypothetical protein